HDARPGARPRRRGPTVPALRGAGIGTGCSADKPDQAAGIVDPHIVDDGLQFASAHGAHRVLLTAWPVGPQKFLQKVVAGVDVAVRHEAPSVTGYPTSVSTQRLAVAAKGVL